MEKRQLVFGERIRAFTLPGWEQIPDLGLYMDQVMTFTTRQLGPLFEDAERVFTPSMVNNYVKMGLVQRPVDKKYGREQLAQLLMVCVLKQSASAEEMKLLLKVEKSGGVRELYEAFSKTQNATFAKLAAGLPYPEPMACALKASAYRLLLTAVVGKGEKQEEAKP